MKARKTLKYTELVMETVSQIGHRFKVETAEIKKVRLFASTPSPSPSPVRARSFR